MEQLMNAITQELDEVILGESNYQDSMIEIPSDIIHATLKECQTDSEHPYKDKIYYSMEKVEVYDPMMNNYKEVINLYDKCSGVSVCENIEDLNVSQNPGTTCINISSISGKEEG